MGRRCLSSWKGEEGNRTEATRIRREVTCSALPFCFCGFLFFSSLAFWFSLLESRLRVPLSLKMIKDWEVRGEGRIGRRLTNRLTSDNLGYSGTFVMALVVDSVNETTLEVHTKLIRFLCLRFAMTSLCTTLRISSCCSWQEPLSVSVAALLRRCVIVFSWCLRSCRWDLFVFNRVDDLIFATPLRSPCLTSPGGYEQVSCPS